MNHDLFDSSNNATDAKAADAAAIAAADAHSDVPAVILELEKIYRAEIALRMEIEAKVARINGDLSRISGAYHLGSIDIGGRSGVDMGCDELSSYVSRVQRIADNELSVEGAPFKGELRYTDYLGAGETIRRKIYDHQTPEQRAATLEKLFNHFSPIALWREIYKQFDPDAQRIAANHKAAHRIRAEFGLLRGNKPPEMKTVSGRVEIVVSVYCRTGFRGERQLSSSSGLIELGEALQQALTDNGMAVTFGTKLTALARHLGEFSGNEIISRERVNLGDGVDVVQGFQAFKLYVPQEIANAVNMFLAEYPEER